MAIAFDKTTLPRHARGVTAGGVVESTQNGSYDGGSASPSDPDVLRKLYENMLACGLLRDRVQSMVREGILPAPSTCREGSVAIEVGSTFELLPEDSLALHHHDLVTCTLKGVSWRRLFGRLQRELDSSPGAAESNDWLRRNLLPATSNVAAQLNLATGVAVAYKQRQQRNVVVALCGEALPLLGTWHDAAKLAGEMRLPIIFVVESRQRANNGQHWFAHLEHLSQRAHDYGFPGITADGDDVVAVFRVAQESIHRARQGTGPTLIECTLSPGSCTPQSATNGTRRRQAGSKDPLAYMEHYLKKRRAWSDSWKQQLSERIRSKIDQAVAGAGQDR